MRLVARFALFFFLASCLGLAAFAYLDAHREVADLRASAAVDMRAFGEGLRAGMLAAREAHGDEKALDVVRAASGRRGDFEVSWAPGAEAFAAANASGRRAAPDEPHRISVAVPVDGAGDAGGVGAIVIRRHVVDEGDIVRAQVVEEIGVAATLAVALGALVTVLGGLVIARPLQRVVAQAQRIGDGDLSRRLASSARARADEIGDLHDALDRMCDRLATARARLERESTARIDTLEQMRHLDRLRTVGTLASSLAHELGTPLNVLLLRGQALAAGEVDAGELPDTGRTIAAQVDKMSAIVRQILDFARRAPAKKADVRLAEVAQRVADLLRALAKKRDAELRVEAGDDAVVEGDAVQLEQAVTNLIVNALHAMPAGGTVRLRVGVADDARASALVAPIRAGFIAVEDEGTGIQPEHLARIFEPFYTSRPAGEGTGLGLVVARGIAEDHGGWITAESEPERGSTFTVYLPLTTSAPS